MSESTQILIAASLGAILFLVALGVIWKRYGARIDTADLLPHNIQLVVDGIRTENKREIVAVRLGTVGRLPDQSTHGGGRQADAGKNTAGGRPRKKSRRCVGAVAGQRRPGQ